MTRISLTVEQLERVLDGTNLTAEEFLERLTLAKVESYNDDRRED